MMRSVWHSLDCPGTLFINIKDSLSKVFNLAFFLSGACDLPQCIADTVIVQNLKFLCSQCHPTRADGCPVSSNYDRGIVYILSWFLRLSSRYRGQSHSHIPKSTPNKKALRAIFMGQKVSYTLLVAENRLQSFSFTFLLSLVVQIPSNLRAELRGIDRADLLPQLSPFLLVPVLLQLPD